MNITRNSVGSLHSSLSYDGMLVCMVPNEFVQNVMQGLEQVINSCKADANCEEYQIGYRNGVEDTVKEICSYLFDCIVFTRSGTLVVEYSDIKEILVKVNKARKMLVSEETIEELPREDLE
jgi:hypothetical protein